MKTETLISKLSDLAQLDIDATYAYEAAIERIEHEDIAANLKRFHGDHVRHINDLNAEIKRLGGTPPKATQDIKGYLLEGFTSLRSITGTEGALKAKETNEILTNKTYKNALDDQELPADIRALIEKNYDDEKRHLEYIKNAISNKLWEKQT